MTLLCGTDFSPNAIEATNVAAELARGFGDSLTLVHAETPSVDDGIAPVDGSADRYSPVHQLELLAGPFRESGLAVETRMESGTPRDALVRSASPDNTRMIVLSSIGRVALSRVLLGSTADRVAESAPVPTLVVRRGMAFTDWRMGRRPLRIFIAVDRSDASDAALRFALTWSQAGPVEWIVGNVVEPGTDADRTERHTNLERDLREKINRFTGDIPYTLVLEESPAPAPAVLIEQAKEHRADLIVTGSHQVRGVRRMWRHSVSRALLADAPINVAVVPCDGSEVPERIPILKRVLVTTDLSPLGNRAIPAACALLGQGGSLRILHILPGGASPGDDAETIRQTGNELTRLVPAEAVERGISVEAAVLRQDDVADAVLQEARRFGAHALCVSSHGRGAAIQLLMGSVAHRILQRSEVPVHVVLPSRD